MLQTGWLVALTIDVKCLQDILKILPCRLEGAVPLILNGRHCLSGIQPLHASQSGMTGQLLTLSHHDC